MLFVYLAATWVLAPLAPLLLRRRLAGGKEVPERWREKLGFATQARPPGRLIWIHAVSVGEGLSALPLLQRLIAADPTLHILLTSSTVTSARLLAGRVPPRVIHQFMPLDLPGPLARFLTHWQPDAVALVESEFWPRMVRMVHRSGRPLMLVNARISEVSARRWARAGGLARSLLRCFSVLTAPDSAAAKTLQRLGADPRRVHVTGALKRAAGRLPVDLAERKRMAGLFDRREIWLAASTHPGEDEVILDAACRVFGGGALLVLVPRHPERAGAIRSLAEAMGLSVAQRSLGELPGAETAVYLADTLGELGLWYDLAPVALVCGSLAPVGGHNAYEPALHGAAILHGPEVGNFADLYARLDAAGAALRVKGAEDLHQAVERLLGDPVARAEMAEAAKAVLASEPDPIAEISALMLGQMEPLA